MKKRLVKNASSEESYQLMEELCNMLKVPVGEDVPVKNMNGMDVDKIVKEFTEKHGLKQKESFESTNTKISFNDISIDINGYMLNYNFEEAGFFVRTMSIYFDNKAFDNAEFPYIVGVHVNA